MQIHIYGQHPNLPPSGLQKHPFSLLASVINHYCSGLISIFPPQIVLLYRIFLVRLQEEMHADVCLFQTAVLWGRTREELANLLITQPISGWEGMNIHSLGEIIWSSLVFLRSYCMEVIILLLQPLSNTQGIKGGGKFGFHTSCPNYCHISVFD